jgi:hypothetical protein
MILLKKRNIPVRSLCVYDVRIRLSRREPERALYEIFTGCLIMISYNTLVRVLLLSRHPSHGQ